MENIINHKQYMQALAIVKKYESQLDSKRDFNFFSVGRQRFVGRVVQHLLHDVQRVVGAGVHARALLDGLQALQYADRAFGISGNVFIGSGGHAGILSMKYCI